MSNLLSLPVNLALGAFCYSKFQEDILYLMKLVHIILHVGYGVTHVPSVFRHHMEVNQYPDASESMFERDYLCTSRLAECNCKHSQNTAPQFPYLFP